MALRFSFLVTYDLQHVILLIYTYIYIYTLLILTYQSPS